MPFRGDIHNFYRKYLDPYRIHIVQNRGQENKILTLKKLRSVLRIFWHNVLGLKISILPSSSPKSIKKLKIIILSHANKKPPI